MGTVEELSKIGKFQVKNKGSLLLGLGLVFLAVAMLSAIFTPIGQAAGQKIVGWARAGKDKLAATSISNAPAGSGDPLTTF